MKLSHEVLLYSLFRFTRGRRMRRFEQELKPSSSDRILDVGGGCFNWQFVSLPLRVTLLNLYKCPIDLDAPVTFESVEGDATDLAYEDASYEIVFSNSVIEHVGDVNAQRRFADELRRVGQTLWVQTPAKEFFLEPHFLLPFVHWLPVTLRRWLVLRLSPRRFGTKANVEHLRELVDEVRLLSKQEMRDMFPDCRIVTERFLLMPKAYIAVRD
ncbi:MAG: methyltransferase domain-containing protein [Planctomycetes bacterium]|nr:methyltransferase domain-containing protein [Planctomycetota bacterium]